MSAVDSPSRTPAQSRAGCRACGPGGFALVLLLLVLSVGSVIVGERLKEHGGQFSRATIGGTALNSARRQLLAYTADYAALYGPGGAGPGHLPCPDTDVRPLFRQPGDWALAGPNPPCAGLEAPWGRLPAHVAFGTERYRLQHSVRQVLWYAVSASFINNPTDRAVGPETPGTLSIDAESGYAAVLIQPPVGQQPSAPHRDGDNRFTRTTDDKVLGLPAATVTRAAARRVELWLAHRAASLTSPRLEQCRQLSVMLADAYRPGPGPGDPLDDSTATALLIESTPAWRHWFFRNGWNRYVQLACEPTCAPAMPRDRSCRWVLAPRDESGWVLRRVPG